MVTALAKNGARGLLRILGRAAESVGRHTGGMAILLWRICESTLRGRVSMREVIARVVPCSLLLAPANAEQLWQDRKRYFFKPLSGFGSKAAYRGDKLTHKTWAQMAQSAYVAQELVPPKIGRAHV